MAIPATEQCFFQHYRAVLNILDNIHDMVVWFNFPRAPLSCASPQLSLLVFGYMNTCCKSMIVT